VQAFYVTAPQFIAMKYALCTIFLLTTYTVFGQNNLTFRTSERQTLGEPEDRSASMGIGDIDQDGDLDVVIANGRHWPE